MFHGLLYVGDAFRQGWSLEDVYRRTRIDRWFLAQIEDLIREEQNLAAAGMADSSTLASMLRDDPAQSLKVNTDDATPLHHASSVGAIRLLVEHGTELNAKDSYHQATALKWMISRNEDQAMIDEMLKFGSKLDAWDYLRLGQIDTFKESVNAHPELLRAFGAEKDIYCHAGSLLHLAAMIGSVEAGQFLRDAWG